MVVPQMAPIQDIIYSRYVIVQEMSGNQILHLIITTVMRVVVGNVDVVVNKIEK